MRTFEDYMEAKKEDSTYQLKSLMDLVHASKEALEKYSLRTRTKAWDKLTHGRGQEEMHKLLKNPSRNFNGFRTL